MGKLRLTLLGRPQVTCDDTPMTGWTLQKSLALLAYLAVTGRPHSRAALAGLFWPNCTEANARSSLRKVVAELRQRVSSHLTITRTEVAFDRSSAYWLDVEAFEQRINRARPLQESYLTRTGVVALTEAIELYRDEFLLDLSVLHAPAFEEWLLLEREHLRSLALRALHALVDHHAARAQPEQTLAYLDCLLEVEPAQEDAHRHKMWLLARGGQRTAALRQYEACRRALQALDAEPDSETTALYRRIRTGADLRVPFGTPEPVTAPGRSLQTPLPPLIGRQDELAEIRVRLQDPSCRLLTLVGPGGVGKTHLALKAVADLLSGGPQDCFADGITVVHLGSVPAVVGIVPTIAQALDLTLSEGAHPQQQVADYLCGKKVLLVMDGFEHLLAGAGLLLELLHAAPNLKILVTSRARLGVQVEHQLPLGGLACPERLPDESESLASMPAIQLYLSSVRRMQPGFEASAADLLDFAHICRLVDGLPLAILLAASWAGMLTPAEIAFQLEGERGLGFLQTDDQDLPARQRSMRAVFDHSWDLLAPRQRQVLANLSVFRGSFTLEAARQVAGASLRELRALIDQSLLQWPVVGRYVMHELLRQYAGERLADALGAAQDARDRHSAYFATAVERWWADLQGRRHQAALAEMSAEDGNLRAAWNWAADRGQVAQLDQAMEGLCYFYKWLGRYEEGESLCRRAVEGLAETDDLCREEGPHPSGVPLAAGLAGRERVRARALAWQGVFCHRLDRREQAWALLEHSLDLLDDLAWIEPDGTRSLPEEIQRGRAFVLWRLGNLASELDRGVAPQLYRQSLALYRALKDHWGTASVLEALGRTATFSEAGDLAHHALEESLELHQAQGNGLGSYRVIALNLATAAYQDQAEEEPGDAPGTVASLMHGVSLALGAGQFARVESLLAQHRSTDGGAGAADADLLDLVRVFNQMHLGHYERARAQTLACLARFRETGYQWGMERCCCYLALAALATGAYGDAQRRLWEAIGLCREIRQRGHQGQALALLALVARGTGDLPQARQHLCEALRMAAPIHDYETFMFQMIVVSAMALLLADQGQAERAVEMYAMAERYPLVAKSRLLEDLAGGQIAAVAAQLPADTTAAVQARGRARDLEAAVADILAELGE
ncbi:MAG: BTAD domain-containing putative transcriptional regulator [Anaerolineae bacterium]|jgi:predicted ATPase/DNA-binding SARP family transcriptional activator